MTAHSSCAFATFPLSKHPYGPLHIKVNGWLMIVMGGVVLLGGLLMGAVFGRVVATIGEELTIAPVLISLVSVVGLAVGAVMIWAGKGLLRYDNRARIVTLIAAVFLLSAFPFGTAIGIYAGWALLTREGKVYFGK